jgi:hypothetical protein
MSIIDNIVSGGRDAVRDIPIVGGFFGQESSYDLARQDVSKYLDKGREAITKSADQGVGYLEPYSEAGKMQMADLSTGMQEGRFDPGRFNYAGEVDDFSYGGSQPRFGSGSRARNMSMGELQRDPGYDFRKKEALTELDRRAAAGGVPGGLGGSGAMRGAAQLASDMASQEYGKAFDRQRQIDDTNYSRDVGEYGMRRSEEESDFNRALQRYGLGRGAEQEQYQRALTGYGLDAQRLSDMFGKGMSVAQMGQQASTTQAGLRSQEGRGIADLFSTQAQADAAARMGEAKSRQKFLGDVVGGAIDLAKLKR